MVEKFKAGIVVLRVKSSRPKIEPWELPVIRELAKETKEERLI